ncbi:MAG: T9SS type A sorting domain-containing protein [Crocinitomicaceae bacterium]|nr:T9SS type A sorting domain-containing protein [Crocinitomicaceae bacterium]
MKKTYLFTEKSVLTLLIFLGFASYASAQCAVGEVEVFIDVTTDDWGYENYWELAPTGSACGSVATIFAGGNATVVGCAGGGAVAAQNTDPGVYGDNITITEGGFCLTVGVSYDLITVDDYGDGGTCYASSAQGFNFCQAAVANETFTFTALAPISEDLGVVGVNEYTMMPFDQANGMNMDVLISNNGTSDATDAIVQTDVFLLPNMITPIQSVTSGPQAVTAGANLTITNGNFAPTVPGDYVIRHAVSTVLLTDDLPTNDTAWVNINVDLTFARDNGIQTGSLGIGAGAGQGSYLGQAYTLTTPANLDSISFFITGASMIGQPINVDVFSTTAGTPDVVIASTIVGTVADTGWVTLGMSGGALNLAAGEYVIAVSEGDSNLTLGTTDNIFTLGKCWVTWDGNPNGAGVWSNNEDFGFNVSYLLRAKFGGTLCSPTTSTISPTECVSYTSPSGTVWTTSSTYTDTIPNAAGCDSIITINLTINTVDITVTTTDPTITANVTGATYRWLDCDSSFAVITGETGQSFTATANGIYAVEVTENGCSDTSACTTIITVSLEENTLFNGVSVFPNPTPGLVNIDLGSLKAVSIKVLSVSGQLMYHKENINASIHQFELDEAPGIYFVEVSSQGEKQYYKLIKE